MAVHFAGTAGRAGPALWLTSSVLRRPAPVRRACESTGGAAWAEPYRCPYEALGTRGAAWRVCMYDNPPGLCDNPPGPLWQLVPQARFSRPVPRTGPPR
ncbi:protein of unknown function [Streptomyces murinus]